MSARRRVILMLSIRLQRRLASESYQHRHEKNARALHHGIRPSRWARVTPSPTAAHSHSPR